MISLDKEYATESGRPVKLVAITEHPNTERGQSSDGGSPRMIEFSKHHTTRNGLAVRLLTAAIHPSTGAHIIVGMYRKDEKSSKWFHASWNAETGRYVLPDGYEPLNREDRADLDLVEAAPFPARRTYGCCVEPGDTLEVEPHPAGVAFLTPASTTFLNRHAVLDLARYLERCAEYLEAHEK